MAKFHVGQHVWYHYRSAIGHGTIKSVVDPNSSDPHYKIAQTDNHPGEPKIVTHRESALHAGSEKHVGKTTKRGASRRRSHRGTSMRGSSSGRKRPSRRKTHRKVVSHKR